MKPRARRPRCPRLVGSAGLLRIALSLACPLLATSPAIAHGDEGEHDHAAAAVPVGTGSGLLRLPDGSVSVPKFAQRRIVIRTVLAPQSKARATVELPGRVLLDPGTAGRVQETHGGRIEAGPRGLPTVGRRVKKGEVLAYVRHHVDPSARAEQESRLAELRAAERIAAARAARLESLAGSIARKDIEAAQAELEGYREQVRAIAHALAAREPIESPVTGVIARADLVVGQVVEQRDILFEIVDPSALVVEATTSDPLVAAGVSRASLAGVPGMRLELLGAGSSLRDGVLPLLFRATVTGSDSPPVAIGQPVTVVAELARETEGIVLPNSAIVRNPQNEPVVWIKAGAERFVPQPVQFVPLDASTILVTRGLAPDNRVVVQGASLLAQIR